MRTKFFLETNPPDDEWLSLHRLMKIHDQTTREQKNAQDLAFGDGYLLMRSFIHRRIRELLLAHDYQFIENNIGNYDVFSLIALHVILEKKQIPVIRNTTVLREINGSMGRIISGYHISRLGIKSNCILHESSHAVSHEYLCSGKNFNTLLRGEDWREGLLKMFLCESFANTSESIQAARIMATLPTRTDLLFLKMNSFFYVEPDEAVQLCRLEKEFGGKKVFLFLWLAYLCSHFLSTHINSEMCEMIESILLMICLEKPNETKELMKHADLFFSNAFRMNDFFKFTVNEFYLRHHGLPVTLREAVTIDYLGQLKNSPDLTSNMSKLLDAILI